MRAFCGVLALLYAVSCSPTRWLGSDETEGRVAGLHTWGADNAANQGTITGKDLRIMPLGDSITQGFRSSDSNGYRLDLENMLLAGYNSVNMVGDFTSGTMADNQEQGIDGATIANISAALPPALTLRPNIVLLHTGTNDMNLDIDVSSAPARLSRLIDQIFQGCPDASILVAKIIASPNTTTNARIKPYDQAVGRMAERRKKQGQHVQVVDMENALPPNQYNDTLHPNDAGYATMAKYWYRGIVEVNRLRWIGKPVAVGN